MSLSIRRRAADQAAATLSAKRSLLRARHGGLQHAVDQWRPTILIGTGLVGGYLLGQRSTVRLVSSAVSLAILGMKFMNSSLGPLILAAAFGSRDRSTSKQTIADDSSINNPPAN